MEKRNIENVVKVLQEITEKYGYRTLEIAYLINDMAQVNITEISQEQIDKINNLTDNVEDLFDEYVSEKAYSILNK